MVGQHYMAHRTNIPMVAKVEDLLQSLHIYFSSSPKRHLEFIQLAKIVEIGRLKILQNVEI